MHARRGIASWKAAAASFKQVKLARFAPETGLKDFDPKAPARFKKIFREYPAYTKWIIRPTREDKSPEVPRLNKAYLKQFNDSIVPLECTKPARDGTSTFERFEAPLSHLLWHMTENKTLNSRLYLAQHALADLPTGMQDDLPTPEILKHLGKGDIYASSLWMGRPPTCTPLHRDPNPNLFVQLSGRKVVRLMRPEVGRQVYDRVKSQIGSTDGSASMRGQEMMQGKELKTLEAAVWESKKGGASGLEIEMGAGDGLYIPLGWWHAVRGIGEVPIVSVNWWFR